MPPPGSLQPTGAAASSGGQRLRRWLLLCLCVGLGLRVLAAGYGGPIKRDGAFYAELGSHLAQGDLAQTFHPKSTPLFPFLLGLVHLVVDDLELSGQIVSVLASTLTIIVVYWLGKLLFDERAGILAATLATIHPFLVRYSGYAMTESLYTFTFALALGAVWLALVRGGWGRYALAGAAVGVSYLARLEGLGLAALLCLGTLLRFKVMKGDRSHLKRWAREVGALVLAGVVFLAMASPQLYFVRQQMGVWSLTPKAGPSALRFQMTPVEFEHYRRSLTPDKRKLVVEALFDRQYRPTLVATGTQVARSEGMAKLAGRWFGVLGRLLAFLPEVHGPLLLIFLVGLLRLRPYGRPYGRGRRSTASADEVVYRRACPPRPGAEIYLGACLLLFLAALSLFQGSRRNLMALVVPMLFWMAVGVVELAALVARWRAPREATAAPARKWVVAALLVSVAVTMPMTLRFFWRADWRWRGSMEKDVGLWAKEQIGAGRTILAFHRPIPFYAQARFVGMPIAPYEDIVTYARLNGVDALILKEEQGARRAEQAALVAQLALDRRWQLIGKRPVQQAGKTHTYRLYRLLAEAKEKVG